MSFYEVQQKKKTLQMPVSINNRYKNRSLLVVSIESRDQVNQIFVL